MHKYVHTYCTYIHGTIGPTIENALIKAKIPIYCNYTVHSLMHAYICIYRCLLTYIHTYILSHVCKYSKYAKKVFIIIVQALRQSVLNGSVSAESLVSMSSTQLATHELLEKVFLCLCMYVCMYHIYVVCKHVILCTCTIYMYVCMHVQYLHFVYALSYAYSIVRPCEGITTIRYCVCMYVLYIVEGKNI